MQTGPYRSALNSVRAGALTMRPSCSVGPGATNSYSMLMFLPGFSPTGPRAPTVIVSVKPSPSGERLFFSSVMPLLISALICSVSISFPFTLIEIFDTSGASNNPGMSSVIRIKLMSAEPLLVKVNVELTLCFRNERSPVLEYDFVKSASTTSNFFDCNEIEPSVLRDARGRIV